jgi:hypothetical protein
VVAVKSLPTAVLANNLENGRYADQNSDGFNGSAAFTQLVYPLLLLSPMRLKTAVGAMAKDSKILQTGHDEVDMFTNFQLPSSSGQSSMAERFSFLFSLKSNFKSCRTSDYSGGCGFSSVVSRWGEVAVTCVFALNYLF